MESYANTKEEDIQMWRDELTSLQEKLTERRRSDETGVDFLMRCKETRREIERVEAKLKEID
jgi:hypothetical protein